MTDLKQIAESLNIDYDVVCEVGVFKPEESHIKNLIPHCKKVIMFEALKQYADEIKEYYSEYDYVVVHNVAINNKNCDAVKLYNLGSSSYIDGIRSPGVVCGQYNLEERGFFFIEGRTFDNYDDGDIDILTCDIEGAEWYVLEKMKSRPKLICLETHFNLSRYVNPFMNEINVWLNNNNYVKHMNDVSDTIYIKQ